MKAGKSISAILSKFTGFYALLVHRNQIYSNLIHLKLTYLSEHAIYMYKYRHVSSTGRCCNMLHQSPK